MSVQNLCDSSVIFEKISKGVIFWHTLYVCIVRCMQCIYTVVGSGSDIS